MPPIQSSAIIDLDYRGASREMLVTFVSGKTYIYYGVPQELFQEFVRATSKGRFFNQAVRNRYFYRAFPSNAVPQRAAS